MNLLARLFRREVAKVKGDGGVLDRMFVELDNAEEMADPRIIIDHETYVQLCYKLIELNAAAVAELPIIIDQYGEQSYVGNFAGIPVYVKKAL